MVECPRDTATRHRIFDGSPLTMTPNLLVICTGNAARSVMAGAFIRSRRPDLDVVTAGTLTVNGQPISWRTREALSRVDLSAPHHRSQQIERHHVEAADLVIALAPEHVEWIRREHPDAAWRTATLKRLARDYPSTGAMTERLRNLQLDSISLESWEEVVDPGGGEVEDFITCAFEVVEVLDQLIERF